MGHRVASGHCRAGVCAIGRARGWAKGWAKGWAQGWAKGWATSWRRGWPGDWARARAPPGPLVRPPFPVANQLKTQFTSCIPS